MNLAEDGAQFHARAIPSDELAHLQAAADTIAVGKAGVRIFGGPIAYATAIIHGSERSRSSSRRRVLQVGYATQGLPGGLR